VVLEVCLVFVGSWVFAWVSFFSVCVGVGVLNFYTTLGALEMLAFCV